MGGDSKREGATEANTEKGDQPTSRLFDKV